MTPPRGPFAVFVRRTADGWYRVSALYQKRPGYKLNARARIARATAGHHKYRRDAVDCARVVLG